MGLLLGAATILLATNATVAGTVRGADTGAPLAGAVVVLSDLDRAVVTDIDGRYVLRHVPAGPHHITIRFIGYAQRSFHALVPGAGRLEINVALQPLPTRLRAVEVHAPVVIRGIGDGDSVAFPDRATSMAAAWNHPLLAEADALQALAGGEIVVRPESPSGVHIRGAASDHTAYALDGIPVFSPYHTAGVFSGWNPDALSGVRVSSAAPSLGHAHSLSGGIEGVTRAPGVDTRARGSVSTTQARLTVDGPLGVVRAGYLVSVRSGFPRVLPPPREGSYLQGDAGDILAKIEVPMLGGQARLLGYDSENEITAAATVQPEVDSTPADARHAFAWQSQSVGAAWSRTFSRGVVHLAGWRALGEASAAWGVSGSRLNMASVRRDEGLLGSVERTSAGANTLAGIRLERITTSYRIVPEAAGGLPWGLQARAPVATGFVHHARALGEGVEVQLGTSVARTRGRLYAGPQGRLRWRRSERLTLTGSYARTHQFAQSLRNAESFVGNVFPADLYLVVGGRGSPVARSDQGVMSAEYRPSTRARIGAQVYARKSGGLILVAPRDGAPFATGPLALGSGTSRGLSVDAAVSAARYALLASYGFQRVRFRYGDSSYVPEFAAAHLFDGGVTVFPTATSSIRVGAAAAIGRRTTAVTGGLEWEACNLMDQGCEFSGSPHNDRAALGESVLPSYVRVDVGVRKHWHIDVGSRDVLIAMFGTVTNVIGRRNVLTYATDPSTGETSAINMRPLAPLVVGLDWRF